MTVDAKRRYAATTKVPARKSRDEVEALVERYGATEFVFGKHELGASVGFRHSGRLVRFDLPMPDPARFAKNGRGRPRTKAQVEAAHDQAVRAAWRSLVLMVKAKFEAVESGITTFETEFLPYTVLPDGSTVGQWAEAELAPALASGRMPRALLGPGSSS